jgi:uncharacterized membrane protein YadS
LVLAIVIGTTVRSLWTPDRRWFPGIGFSAKILLEVAVVLLGVSISAKTILAAGPWMLLGIAGVVASAIGASFVIGRCCACRRAWPCWWLAAIRSAAIRR